MGWGSTLGKLWGQATETVQKRAADLARTTRALVQDTVDAVASAGKAVADAAVSAGKAVVGGAKQGIAWVGDAMKAAGRAVTGAIAWLGDAAEWVVRNLQRHLLRGAQWLQGKLDPLYRKVCGWFRRLFGEEAPSPCIDCGGAPPVLTDKQADGVYFGADGRATRDLQTAKDNAVRPSPDFACCKGKVDENRVIYYVNGINTDQHQHNATLQRIAHTMCAKVVGIYNATEGMVTDSFQTARDRALIDQAQAGGEVALDGRNPAVDTVSKTIQSEVRAGNKVEIISHSQGGAVTSLGMYGARNKLGETHPNPLGNVSVISLGSAAPQWPSGAKYEHRAHVDDWTPMGLGLPRDQLDHVFDGPGADGQFIQEGQPGFEADMLAPTKNHKVDEVYLRELDTERRKQGKGGCGAAYDKALQDQSAQPAVAA